MEDLKNLNYFELRHCMIEINYIQVVIEITKILSIFSTLGTNTASVETTFSTLKRIKTFSRNKSSTERTSSLVFVEF